MFNAGDASNGGYADFVTENLSEGTDTILFGPGIDAEDVRLWTDSSGYLYLKPATGELITVVASATYADGAYMTRVGEYVESIVFDDETVWDLTGGLYLKNDDTGRGLWGSAYGDTIEGGTGSDNLYGGDGADTLTGGTSQDQVYGGTGDDTFVFNAGDASNGGYADFVTENLSEGTDTILFGPGIDPEDVRLWTDSSGYLYLKPATGELITVVASATYADGAYMTRVGEYVESITFDDDTVWDLTGGLTLKSDDTSRYLYGSAYGDTIEGGSANDVIYSGDGADTLIGNAGIDAIYGGAGNDTYVFDVGDASNGGYADFIYENLSEGTDTILFGSGIDPEDVRLWVDYSGYLYIIPATGELITVSASATFNMTRVGEYVESITFDDDTVWDLTGGLTLKSDDTSRYLYGSAYGDTIEGGSANDVIYSGEGADTLIGNAGIDAIYGGAGNDTYKFN